jgi:hypothetical protein
MTGFKRMILGAVVAATAVCTTTPAGPAPGRMMTLTSDEPDS